MLFRSPRVLQTVCSVESGSSTLQNRRSVKLLDYSLDISDYHADFHEGHGTVRAGQGRGMACVNLTNGMARERHGRGMLCVNPP